jgi:hypothetical protein
MSSPSSGLETKSSKKVACKREAGDRERTHGVTSQSMAQLGTGTTHRLTAMSLPRDAVWSDTLRCHIPEDNKHFTCATGAEGPVTAEK